MQKNIKIFELLLQELDMCESIDEIFVIDNSQKGINFESDKLKVFTPEKNLYVNPSWNFGISNIKNEYFCILNDDILLPKNLFVQVLEFIKNTPKCGLVGLESSKITENTNIYEYPSDSIAKFKKIKSNREQKNWYWGAAIFGKKENFYKIPNDLLIYCGDDYQIYSNRKAGKTNYAINNIKVMHIESQTSNNKDLASIKKHDMELYSRIDNDFKKHQIKKQKEKFIKSIHLKGFEYIFAVKNIKNKKYKYINIFGVKFLVNYLGDIKFSIIMPTYNRAFCIENAINSLLNQSYKNYELIIIDDGSTDNTKELLESKYSDYLNSGKFVYKYINHLGVSTARNIGIKLSKNQWIAYLDTDNTMKSKYLATFKKAIINNPKCKCFYARFYNINKKTYIGKSFDYKSLRRQNYIDMGVFVHHKLLPKKLGGFNTSLTRLVDWDLILNYTEHYRPHYINEVLLLYNDSMDFKRISNTENYNSAEKIIKNKFICNFKK